MGIHSGPVSRVVDVNERSNAAGAGINIAERVMSCGDAGHILFSKRAAEDLIEYAMLASAFARDRRVLVQARNENHTG